MLHDTGDGLPPVLTHSGAFRGPAAAHELFSDAEVPLDPMTPLAAGGGSGLAWDEADDNMREVAVGHSGGGGHQRKRRHDRHQNQAVSSLASRTANGARGSGPLDSCEDSIPKDTPPILGSSCEFQGETPIQTDATINHSNNQQQQALVTAAGMNPTKHNTSSPVAHGAGPPMTHGDVTNSGNWTQQQQRQFVQRYALNRNGGGGAAASAAPFGPKKALGRFTKAGCFTVTHNWYLVLPLVIIVLLFGLIFMTSVVPHGELYSYVVASVFMAFSIASILTCVLIDPGIVPPAARPAQPLVPTWATVNGTQVECPPCRTCHIHRPPRSTHCQFSDVCVYEFHHYCSVTGVLVARRTFRFFAFFFFSTAVLSLYMFIRSITILYAVRDTFTETPSSRWQFAAGIVCTIASFSGGCFVIPFSFMYVFEACLNTTQKESMRARAQGKGPCEPNRPYATDPCTDCWSRFCSRIPPEEVTHDYYV